MSKKLENAVSYSNDRISIDELDLDSYVTTDNLLQNKQGKTQAVNLPPQGGNVTKFEIGDILIANIRPYLKKIWLAKYPGGSSADVLTLNVNSKYDPGFIYYTIHRDIFFEHVMNGSKGTKMPRGDKDQILEFPIPEFDKQTQIKISKVLSDLDAKIELNNKINEELEAMAKLIYDYWFVQFDFPISKEQAQAMGKPELEGKPYKSSGGKMVYNQELKREIPEGWGVKKLKEFANTGSGGTPLKSKREYYENGKIPWINSGEVNEPFIINAEKFITEKGLNESSAKIFKKGTILMAMYGATAGKVSLMDLEACTNQAICGINPNEEYYSTFVKFGLENLYNYLINLSSGSARDNLSQEWIRELEFPFPSEQLLINYHSRVNSLMLKILLNLKENNKLTKLRDWLLPMLMNGQVTVGEAEVELSKAADDGVVYKEIKTKEV